MSKAKQKEKKEKEREKVKFTNAMFDNLSNNPNHEGARAFQNFLNAKFASAEKYKLFKLFRAIVDSAACKAFDDARKQMIERFEDEQKELDDDDPNRKPLLTMNVEGLMDLLEQDSEFEIEKIGIPLKSIPESVTANDMIMMSWIIDFDE